MAASSSTTSTVWLGESTAARKCMRIPILGPAVYYLKMRREPCDPQGKFEREIDRASARFPRPSPQFRRRAWFVFQRALDPLAKPRPLRGRQQR
jgi:hypothetical protein